MSGPPAARVTDPHACPMVQGPVPHVGGIILLPGCPTVLIGGMPAARLGELCMCTGPLDSIAWGAATVLIGGQPAARMGDLTFHGGVVMFGWPTVLINGPVLFGWTLPGMLAILCANDRGLVDDVHNGVITLHGFNRVYFNDPYYDGSTWTTQPFEAAGTSNGGITIVNGQTNEEAATTLFHENVHHHQPAGWTWPEKEYDAYRQTEQWTIDRGLPSQQDPAGGYNFRTTDAHGNTVVDDAEVRRFVNDEYPVTSTPPPAVGPPPPIPDQVVGRTASGDSILERADGTTYTRPPQAGDTYSGPQLTEGTRLIDPSMFVCP